MMSYHFKFYTEFNTDKVLLKNKIKESVRDLKLKKNTKLMEFYLLTGIVIGGYQHFNNKNL
jgi:hypothetical protein